MNPTTITTATEPRQDGSFIRRYFEICGRLFSEPGAFFRAEFQHISTSQLLTIGVVSSWLSTLVAFLFSTVNSLLFFSLFERWFDTIVGAMGGSESAAQDFIWTAGRLTLHPFFVCLQVCLTASVIYGSARLLIGKRSFITVRYQGILRILGISLVGQWLQVVPFLGPVLAMIASFLLAVTGLREVYRVSTSRAAAVVLAPYLLLMMLVLLLVLLMVVVAIQLGLQGMAELGL